MPTKKKELDLAAVQKRRLQIIQRQAQQLIKRAAQLQVVVTIEQHALTPLAMGHYKTTSSVRTQRVMATPMVRDE